MSSKYMTQSILPMKYIDEKEIIRRMKSYPQPFIFTIIGCCGSGKTRMVLTLLPELKKMYDMTLVVNPNSQYTNDWQKYAGIPKELQLESLHGKKGEPYQVLDKIEKWVTDKRNSNKRILLILDDLLAIGIKPHDERFRKFLSTHRHLRTSVIAML